MSLSIANFTTSVGELQRDYLYKLVVESKPSAMLDYDYNAADGTGQNESWSDDPDETDYQDPTISTTSNTPDKVMDIMDLFSQKGIWPSRKTDTIEKFWSGEKYFITGRDGSAKTGQLMFNLDEGHQILDFWESAKEVTGTNGNHASANLPSATMELGIYMVNSGKNTVTDYRGLRNVLVLGVDVTQPDKEGSGVAILTVDICWYSVKHDRTKRGLLI